MISALPLLVLLAALLLGVPIAFSLAGAGIFGIWLITDDWNIVMGIVGSTPFSSTAVYVLTTAPMFVLMAYFSASSGLARNLFTAAANWLSHIRGGLAIATVFACGIFGAMSGASVAAAAVMANVAMPEMRRLGYSEELSAGTIGVGSTLNILIPPSVAMVVYGVVTGTSIGKLLIAGIIPGIVLGIILCMVILVWVNLVPSHCPATHRVGWKERFNGLLAIWPCLLLIFLVLTLLYTGIATPTEVGAIGAALAGIIGAVMRRLTLSGVLEALKMTVRTSAMIFMILIGATIFGYYMTLSGIPREVVRVVTELNPNRWVVITGIIVGYFIVSMLMDELPLMLITLQLTFPLIVKLGFDPIWFGVVSMMMIAMGLVFPPVGLAAFVVSATANVSLMKVYKGTSILTIALVLTALAIMIFPQLVLWLPARMR